MNFRFLICLIALPATACTIAPQDNGIDAQIHPPLTYKNWTSNQYVSANGLPV